MSIQTIYARQYAGEADLQPIADMINACDQVDQFDEGTSVVELQSEFSEPSFDPARDLRLWEDDGRLVGFGQMWIPPEAEELEGFLWFKVHPDARGNDLEAQIIAWGEQRMREVSRERGRPVMLRAAARDVDTDRSALLGRLGFSPVRYFLRMVRPLDEPISEPQFPAGFTLRPIAGEHEAEDWAAMFNESFIDHWSHHPWSAEKVKHWMREPHYRPDLHLIAVDAQGTFAAFCWASINPEENARSGLNEGMIGLLGTRRGFRKIGLGRAILLAGLQRLKAAGAEQAKLGVDAQNPTGATKLYESVGFKKLYTRVLYSKDL